MATTRSPRNPAPIGPNGSSKPVASPGTSKGRNGRKPPPKKRTFWGKLFAFFQVVFLLILVCAIAIMAAVFVIVKQAPSKRDVTFNPRGVTMIYSSDDMLLAKYFVENRQTVSIDQIPLDLQHATVAFEDRRFYQHHGIDFTGVVRAVVSNVRHGDMHGEGGSTITQQLARNLGVGGLTREKSIQRKLNEWLIANQIEHSYSKQQILEMYLNEVNYGSGAYGVEAAAKTYFGKDVKNLTLAECALLAGLPNRPTFFNPYRDKEQAKKQRNIVLDWMLSERYITAGQCASAKAEPVKLASPHAPKQGSTIYRAPYFVSYVYEQLKDRYGDQYLKDGNLRVYTTLNWEMQAVAEQAVKDGLAHPLAHGPNEACLVAMDPKTGEIKAMVGGADYKRSQFNIAAQGRRQPGSLFKAILYSAAIDSGLVTEDTRVLDSPVSYPMAGGEDWTPKDDDGPTYDHVTLKRALAKSINIPAVKVMKLTTPTRVIQYARLMGINSPLDPVLSLALGSSAVTPLEMVDAYATFPNGGNHVEPMAFTRVDYGDGKPMEDMIPPPPTRVLSVQTVQQLDDMLRAVVTEGTGAAAGDIPDAHGKTGTTQDHRDTWFIGYTPDLICGVWMGHPIHDAKTGKYSYGDSMAGNAWGATLCVPIWKNFMKQAEPIFKRDQAKEASRWKGKGPTVAVAPKDGTAEATTAGTTAGTDTSASKDHRPKANLVVHNADGTVTVNIDNDTGLLAPPGSPNSQPVNFAAGTEPTTLAPQYSTSQTATPEAGPQPTNSTETPAPAKNSTTTPTPSSGTDTTSRPALGDTTTDQTTTPDNAPTDTAITTSPIANTPDSANTDDSNTAQDQAAPQAAPPAPPRPPVHHHRPAPPPEYVTVYINPDDGLLANQWTPEKVPRTYLKGTQPRRVTTMYGPPPGER